MSSAVPTTVSKMKTYIGLAGSLLAFIVPLALEVSNSLPSPWPAVIGAVVAVLTAAGIYKAPYVKPGDVVVPAEAVSPAYVPQAAEPTQGGVFRNPWR